MATSKSSKANGATKSPKSVEHVEPIERAIPAGMKEQSDNVDGFWVPETNGHALDFIPRNVRLSDSKLDPKKTSPLITGELTAVCPLVTSDGEVIDGLAGMSVGVWYKPGMSAIRNLAGVRVFMFQDGEQDTGKPNAMKVFRVHAAKKGEPLPVAADNRKQSRGVKSPFLADEGSFRGEVPEGEI